MTGVEIAVPAVTAIIIQGIQAWIAMSKMVGLSEEQIDALFQSELAKFNQNTPDKLPDA